MPRIASAPSRFATSAYLNATADAAGFAFAGSPEADDNALASTGRRFWPLAVVLPAIFALAAIWAVASLA